MKISNGKIVLFIVLASIAIGCGNSSNSGEDATEESSSLIRITKEQFEADSMKIGEVTLRNFSDEVRCNGYITAPANGIAQVSAPVSGQIQSIQCKLGDYVKKGQTVCLLSSIELIEIQQEFNETAALLNRIRLDYERSKALFDEKIGAEKDFIALESEYKMIRSKYQSLKLQLELLHLNVSKIEAGELFSVFHIISPINGYITRQNMILGQFIEKQLFLAEIVDAEQLQIQLAVFEKDVFRLSAGQPVLFGSAGQTALVHTATLTAIGKAIDPESMTIPCLAKINDEQKLNFINRTYIEAVIIVDQTEANALPDDAILKSGKDNVILILEKSDNEAYYVRMEKINVGRTSHGFSEITGNVVTGKVIIKGVYNIRTE